MPDEIPESPERPRGPRFVEAIGIGGGLLIVAVGFLAWSVTGSGDDPAVVVEAPKPERYALLPAGRPLMGEFAGDDACMECHPGIAAWHDTHGHSRTLRPAARRSLAKRLDGRRVEDPERPGVSWEFALRDGEFVVDRTEGGEVETEAIGFAFGSGVHATTFISLLPSEGNSPAGPASLEHRFSYFAHLDGLDVTPGQKPGGEPEGLGDWGRVRDGMATRDCFDCHVTRSSAEGPGRFDPETMIPTVSCERCHGPAAEHVALARDGVDDPGALALRFGPGRASPAEQMQLCGYCHRHPSTVAASGIRADNPQVARFQPVGLMHSRCYTRTPGGIACTRCHDPHRPTERDPGHYVERCLDCHRAGVADTSCPVSPSVGCVDCHMPRVEANDGLSFADHWIRVRRETVVNGESPH